MRNSIIALGLVTACASLPQQVTAPAWFENPPTSARSLNFAGDSSQAQDPETAKLLALQKALHKLSVYCGARVRSNFQAVDREHNQVQDQFVSMNVEVAGEELDLGGLQIKKTVVQQTTEGYAAFALVSWPRSEFDALKQAKARQAGHALALNREAQALEGKSALFEARARYEEAQQMLKTLIGTLALEDATLSDTRLLSTAIDASIIRVDKAIAERARICGIAVSCAADDRTVPCTHRDQAVREAVTRAGKTVSHRYTARNIADAIDATQAGVLPEVGCAVSVAYTAKSLGSKDRFAFVRAAAELRIMKPNSGEIIRSRVIPETKTGHLTAEDARKKAWDKMERIVKQEIRAALAGGEK